MRDLILNVFECGRKRRGRLHFEWKIDLPRLKQQQTPMPLELTITNEQKVKVHLTPVTDTGKAARLDGIPAWTVASGNSTIEVAADGLSADLISADDPGDTSYVVSADADLGEGVETISDSITLHVQGARAVNLGLSADAPVPKA